jgi:N-ethylmaleimide reductase
LPGTFILNAAFSLPAMQKNLTGLLEDGSADLVAIGRAFTANPDLVRRR